MTSRVTIKNEDNSNGDLFVIQGEKRAVLLPGESVEYWVSTGSGIYVGETWPTLKGKADEKAKTDDRA